MLALAVRGAGPGRPRPYIGFVYPAGGQQGTTFQIRLGGQDLDGVDGVLVSGTGFPAKVVEYQRTPLPGNGAAQTSNCEAELSRRGEASAQELQGTPDVGRGHDDRKLRMKDRAAPRRTTTRRSWPGSRNDWPNTSAAGLRLDLQSGLRRGYHGRRRARRAARNPPGHAARGVATRWCSTSANCPKSRREADAHRQLQVLGKEEQALRKRPADEVEQRITCPARRQRPDRAPAK